MPNFLEITYRGTTKDNAVTEFMGLASRRGLEFVDEPQALEQLNFITSSYDTIVSCRVRKKP